MKKRILAALLTLVMALSLLPVSALAATGDPATDGGAQQSAMNFTKTADGPDANGNYTITMTAQATGKEVETTKTVPMDIVLVLDVSGSMDDPIPERFEKIDAKDVKENKTYYVYAKHSIIFGAISWHSYDKVTYCEKCKAFVDSSLGHELHRVSIGLGLKHKYNPDSTQFYTKVNSVDKINALKTAVNGFIDQVAQNSADSSIAVVSFATNKANVSGGLLPAKTSVETLKAAVNGLHANGATRADLGMQEAARILDSGTNSKKVVVMFTDGEPTRGNTFEDDVANDAISAAKDMKDKGTEVFTVGVFDSDPDIKTYEYMNFVSSNYPQAKSMSDHGDGSDKGYYMTASDADGLNNIFKAISDKIIKPVDENLNTSTVITDTLSNYFTFATDVPTNDVKVYAEKGGVETDITGSVTVNADAATKTVTVTGYDFSKHYVGIGGDAEEKLVIKITVKPSGAGSATANIPTNADDATTGAAAKVTLNGSVVASRETATVTGLSVAYDLNGADGTAPATMYYPSGAEVTVAAAPSRTGYDFAGWNTAANGTGTSYAAGAKIEKLTENVTLYAQWTKQKFTVTWMNGTNQLEKDDNVEYGTTPEYNGNEPTKAADADHTYAFLGWNTDPNATTALTQLSPVTADVTYYAIFSATAIGKYTLTYDANGGTLDSGMTNSKDGIASGENVSLDYIHQPTHSPQDGKNVIFIGWALGDTNEKVYAYGDTLPDIAHNVTFENENITAYAVWGLDANKDGVPDVLEAKVTYKIENGTWFDAETGTTTGTEIVHLVPLYEKSASGVWKRCNATLGDSIPTGRTGDAGYTADGWYKDTETAKTDISANTSVTGDVTYTFKYVQEDKPDTYTVVLHLDGGTYTTVPAGYTAGSSGYSYTLNAATDAVNPNAATLNKSGYEFKGWSLSDTAPQTLIGTNETFASLSVQQNGLEGNHDEITLYAVWEEKTPEPDTILGILNQYVWKQFDSTYGYSTTATFTVDVTVYQQTVLVNSSGAAQQPAVQAIPQNSRVIYTGTGTVTLSTGSKAQFQFKGEDVRLEPYGRYAIVLRERDANLAYVTCDTEEHTYAFAADEHGQKTLEDIVIVNSYDYYVPFIPVNPTPSKPALNTDDHYAYIVGYPDGTVRPNGSITRAEAATIFFRLLTDAARSQYWSTTNAYSDVAAGSWYNNAVSTMSSAGIVNGYPDGTFRPDAPITRAEMAKMISLFAKLDKTEDRFTDIAGHWAEAYIKLAAGNGWIEGYPDGSFRPQQSITRAETVTMINRVLERVPSTISHLLPYSVMQTYPDCVASDWYYIAIQEATNSHTYERAATEKNGDEQWIALRANRDWTELER